MLCVKALYMVFVILIFTLFSPSKKRYVSRIDSSTNTYFLEDKSKVERKLKKIQTKILIWILYAHMYRKDYIEEKSHNAIHTYDIHRISS